MNNWDFPPRFPDTATKGWYRKLLFDMINEKCLNKMSLRDQLGCLVDFVGTILLCLLPLPNCFLRVCIPTLYAADSKDFQPLITSPISGAANSNKSAPTRFAAGTIYLCKNGIAVLPITCATPPSPLSSNRSIFWNFYLS